MHDPVLAPVRGTFRAIATSIVPESGQLDESGWTELEGIVENALARRRPGLRRQLRLFIRLLGWLPMLRYGKPFHALDPARRDRFLGAVQDSRMLLIRRGFWGLRTLVFMGYYARPAAAREIGYRADPRGWEVRRKEATEAR